MVSECLLSTVCESFIIDAEVEDHGCDFIRFRAICGHGNGLNGAHPINFHWVTIAVGKAHVNREMPKKRVGLYLCCPRLSFSLLSTLRNEPMSEGDIKVRSPKW